jgi:adenylate cyclase
LDIVKTIARLGQKFGLGRLVCLLMLVALVALRVADPSPIEALRMRTFDFYQRLKPRVATLRPAVIIDIDEKSLATYGQWPWPRTLLADLVSRLAGLGSAAIGVDIVFAEPDRTSPRLAAQSIRGLDAELRERLEQLPGNDEALAAAIQQTRLVLGQSGHYVPIPPDGTPPAPAAFATLGPDPSPFLITYPGLIRNVPVLEHASAGRGLLNSQPEADGIVRRIPLVMKAQGMFVPALTLDMLRVVTGAGAIMVRTDAAGIRSVTLPGLQLPTDRNGQLWIYFGAYDPSRYVSAADVLQGSVSPDRIARRLVLIGTSAVGLRDIKTTPLDPAMSGVEVHAQALENILTNSFLVYPNYAIGAELATAVLLSLVIIAIGPILGASMMLATGAAVAALLAAGSWYFFTQQRLLLDATYPLLCTFLIFLTLIFTNYFREQMHRRRIRSAFGQYLAPSLVEQLAHSSEKLVLGGEVRNMTILFSDVRGFTTISELYKDDPQGLTSLMNHFLTPMTNAIIEHNGTIDKYIGDAIMAFWNAPLQDDKHELNACTAALELLDRVDTLNGRREQEARDNGHPFIPIKIGVGLNTGRCVVGNMGSDLRFNYSVLGDAVNLASRLEGQSKSYGVPIIIGSRTAQAAQKALAVLEIDCITVKGKTEPESIFALLGDENVAKSNHFQRVRDVVGEMLALYRRREFAAVEQMIVQCREAAVGFPLDDVFDLYSSRVRAFRAAPPSDDWNGVWLMETK